MSEHKDGTVTLMSGGDIGPVYEPTEEFVELIAPVLKQADLGQCEPTGNRECYSVVASMRTLDQ